MGNFLEDSVKILKLFVVVGWWYTSKFVKKKINKLKLIFNEFVSPVEHLKTGKIIPLREIMLLRDLKSLKLLQSLVCFLCEFTVQFTCTAIQLWKSLRLYWIAKWLNEWNSVNVCKATIENPKKAHIYINNFE